MSIRVGLIGVSGYGWQTKIIDPEGNEVAQGDVGELCLKGPGVMTCYYRDPEATAATLKDGWLLTGDMAMQDEEDFIYNNSGFCSKSKLKDIYALYEKK